MYRSYFIYSNFGDIAVNTVNYQEA